MSASPGFKTDFMGAHLKVDFPELSAAQKKDLVPADAAKTGELTFPHFSIFLSASRKFPFFTMTNIDGHLFKKIPRNTIFPGGSDVWSFVLTRKAYTLCTGNEQVYCLKIGTAL